MFRNLDHVQMEAIGNIMIDLQHNSVQKEEIYLPLDSSNIIDLRLLLSILYYIHSISRSH